MTALTHFLRILLAAMILSGFLLAGLALNAEAAAPEPVKASEVLAEAKKYLGVRYLWGGFSANGFDCSGYVSVLWKIPRHTTDTMHGIVRVINKDELLPGDALNYPLAGRVGHIRIFDKWATADKALVWVYEATEPEVMHRVVPYDPRYIPVRRLNIVSDVPMPPPPPLPANWNKPPKTTAPPTGPAPVVQPPGNVFGRVVDEKTGAAVKSARVFYWSESDQYNVSSVVADGEGRFKVEKLKAGKYEMAAYAKGYDVEFRPELDLGTGGTATIELKLAPALGDVAGARIGSGQPQPTDRAARDVAPAAPINDDPPASLPLDHEIPGGWFYTQTAGRDGIGGFGVTDDAGIRFWKEFKRLGGVQGVGYPVSRRFKHKGFTVQAFQKGILQWRPEVGEAWFTNVFDELHDAGKDDWLLAHRSTPRPVNPSIDDGKAWAQVIAGRLAFLVPQLPIKQRYSAVADPMTFFGLPTSKVEDQGNHWAVRLQRGVIQLWKVDVPWAKAGQTTVANGGDVAKEAGLLPAEAIASQRSPILGR